MKKGKTINREPLGIETLDLQTAFCHDHNNYEYVRIGVVPEDAGGEDGTISFQLVQYSTESKCKALQACLLEEEIDIVIGGLQKAKRRLQEYKEQS